ncbi:hypothetical protein FRC01_005112 [Tulasnella sp. 417]|nr:hypothetical protein FRC01_005112 [Tulasnella sp. 417]
MTSPARRGNPKAGEVYVDNPDEGWDAETEGDALVIDYDTKQEMKKTIAQTAAMLNPKHPFNGSYAFQKVFMDGEFVAGGVLEIPVGGKKPSKPARDNTYLFYCIEGAIRVVVHQNTFVIARNGMFMVPRGNQYHLENISNHRCKLFFAQARKVTEKIILHRPKRTSMAPSAREASASQTPEPAARVVMNSTVSSDPGKGPNCS